MQIGRWLAAAAFSALPAMTGVAAAQERAAPPQLSFKLTENFLKLPPNITMAEVVGVDVDSKGHIYVVNRGKQPILEFNPDGTFARSVGDGLPFEGPHSIRVDPQDNIWFIDAGTNLIVKFDPEKRVQMVLGRRPEPWTWETHVIERAIPAPANFYQPTDVTWGPDGSIYVADGYGNSRIAKFNKEGNLVKHWGERGTALGEFNTPHSIVIDAQNNLYVADRQNGRIQVFDTDGNAKQQWRVGGNPWSLCMPRGQNSIMYVGSVGRVLKIDLKGKVLGSMGHFGRVPGTFDWVHAVSCPDEHTLYAAQELSFRLHKIAVQ
jgi:DNA-binding beta-propeller fold protein YncE